MNRLKPDEGAWARVLGSLGISGAGPELLWESPLDWGRRVYRSKNRVYKIVLLENHTTGDLRNRTLQEESDILRALTGIRGIPACLEYRPLPGAEVIVMGLVDALPWAAYRGGLAKACITFPRLVGLLPVDGSTVPAEASQILANGDRIAGRITSSRMSPTLGRSICLAQVEAALAAPGTRVTVRLPGGRLIGARVMEHLAHVDPEGSRMRV